MAFKPTKNQKDAIKAKGCVLVSAAAGSGKTAVLVERVIKMLTDSENPVFADRLLIVTFTNAAAAEMLSRIEARLYEEYEKTPQNEHISKQRYLIKSANICTIDSFCIRLVRDNFALVGIEPDFRVTDDSSLYAVRCEVLRDILNEYLKSNDKNIKSLLEIAGCRFGEDKLIELIDNLYISSLKKPFPKVYLSSLKEPYFLPFNKDHIWYKYAFSLASDLLNETKSNVEKLCEAALYCEAHDKATLYAQIVSSIVYSIDEAVNYGEWDKVFETVHTAGFGKLPRNCTDEFKGLRDTISSDIAKIGHYFYECSEKIQSETIKLAPAVNLLFDIIDIYSKKLFSRLKEENIFSFDDVEQLAMSLLTTLDENGNIIKTAHADEVISRYDEVLVDEFQDVNDLQNTLFEVLSANSEKLFVVGDVKQSIYAFRGSNPNIFLNKKNAYSEYSADMNDKKKIILSHNYRSRKGICDSVNFFFEKLMTKDAGKLIYNEEEMLIPGADYPENGDTSTDFLLIDKVDDESSDSVIESEAAVICNYIKEVMAKGNILRAEDGSLRPAAYGDFCILLAELKEKAGVISNILNSHGIPCKVSDGSFFDSTEIITVLSLLHTIDNPKRDVYLLRALMSPIYGFTAEELAKIRIGRGKVSLYSALCAYANEDSKAQKFLSEISGMRRMSCVMPVNKFLSYVIDKTDMMNIFYTLPGGDLRAENLMTLLRLADEYADDMSGSVFGFLRYIEALPKNAVKVSGSEDEQCVKIMSIHRSKGLQFPICIVAGLSHKMNKWDSYDNCLYSGDYGIGFKYYDREKADKEENLAHRLLSNENLKRIAEERLRLLYVAMTRAEEKLCLICCLKNANSALLLAANASDMGRGQISGRFIKNAQNSAQYIIAAALLHPDAEIIRRVTERKIKTHNANGNISFKFIDAARLNLQAEEKIESTLPNSELSDKIQENTRYKYPFESLRYVPAKTSVSVLANKAEAEHFAMSDRPAFMEKDGLSAAGRGTAIHKIMQFIRLDGDIDIENEIKRLLSENRITENEAGAADRQRIKAFLESDIYKRIRSAKTVRREMRFLTELPVSYYGINTDDKFIVQGAVDLCFTEPDGVVVLDFKTDRVNSPDELKVKYAEQLNIYATACEKIFSLPVKEKIIYSFCLSEAIEI